MLIFAIISRKYTTMKTYDELNSYIGELCEYSKSLSDLSIDELNEFITNFIALEKGEKMILLEMIIDNISETELKNKTYYTFLQNKEVMSLLKEMLDEL